MQGFFHQSNWEKNICLQVVTAGIAYACRFVLSKILDLYPVDSEVNMRNGFRKWKHSNSEERVVVNQEMDDLDQLPPFEEPH